MDRWWLILWIGGYIESIEMLSRAACEEALRSLAVQWADATATWFGACVAKGGG